MLETLFVKVAGLKAFTNTYFDEHLRTAASASCGYGNFFIVWSRLFFMGIMFCSSVILVWTFSNRGVHNFNTKKTNISVNLVPFFNGVLFLFCDFLSLE